MAAPDEGPQAEKKGLPLWVIIGGGLALAAFLYFRSRGTATSQGPLVPVTTGATDPVTGQPFSGTPSTRTTQDWITAAESYAQSHHMNLGLVAQAIYNWTNGLRLTEAQAHVLQQILGAIGYPPDQFPWLGPTGNNPAKPKGPFFNWSTWKWFGLQKGESYATDPKVLGTGWAAGVLTELGKIGSNILMPLANAPIYALVPKNWTATSHNMTGPLEWRRIDSGTAFSALPRGTRIATYSGYAPAAA